MTLRRPAWAAGPTMSEIMAERDAELAGLRESLRAARRELEASALREASLRRVLQLQMVSDPASMMRRDLATPALPPPKLLPAMPRNAVAHACVGGAGPSVAAPLGPLTSFTVGQSRALTIASDLFEVLCADLLAEEARYALSSGFRAVFSTLPVHVFARVPAEMLRLLQAPARVQHRATKPHTHPHLSCSSLALLRTRSRALHVLA